MENALTGKRILITQSTEFMGPVLCDVFAQQGAEVVASSEYLVDPDAAGRRFKRIPGSRSGWRARRQLGRLVSAREDAQFAAYLCSSAADCFVGQVFPVCGGWVVR